MRPDVFTHVNKIISPTPLWRSNKAPVKREWEEGPLPKEKDDKKPKKEAADDLDEKDILAKRKEKAEANVLKGKEEKKKQEKDDQDAFDADVCPDCKKKAAAPPAAPAKEEAKADDEGAESAVAKEEEVPAPAEPKAALAQKDEKDKDAGPVGDPERVHILEPRVYQDRANTNTPNTRTTFYAKKNPSKMVI